jgi:Leucine-rich repeat (LRR) protein
LSQKNYLQESIQYLGFSGNELTFINLKRFMRKNGELKNLQYFDLSKNSIYEFLIDNFKACPKMKVLDLSDNNISNFTFFSSISPLYSKKKMNCAVLMSNNIFVTNNKVSNLDYRKYMHLVLTTFKYKIKKLNLTLLYNKDTIEELSTLRISPSVKISLIKLNLSFCGIQTETIWKFFQNNYGLLNLVSLNLSYNFISNNFFTLCSGQDILLEKLKVIDLSYNKIICKDINEFLQINKFIGNYQKMKRIKMQKNDFGKDLISLYTKNEKEMNEILNKLNKDEFKFFVEMKVLSSLKDYPDFLSKLKNILEFNDKSI